jgi:prepilin-type N-terminal cleavage/methylation domain-containing protein
MKQSGFLCKKTESAASCAGKNVTRSAPSLRHLHRARRLLKGFTTIELMMSLVIGGILTAMAIPVLKTSLSRAKVNAAVSQITSEFTKVRYRAIRNCQIYTMTITAPQNTYQITNVSTGVVFNPDSLPTQVAINGGGAGAYTYTFCPNGMVYGAGGACPNGNVPSALTVTYQTRQTNMSFSQVGNVISTIIR